MAKIVVTVDTDDKSMEATIDGKAVDNLTSAYFYGADRDGYGFGVSINTFEKDGDLRKYTSISASAEAEEEIKAGKATASTKYPGFAEKPDTSPLQKCIASLINRNKR